MHRSVPADDHAWRRDWQAVAPFAGEHGRAFVKPLPQPDVAGIMLALSRQRKRRQALFMRLKTKIHTVEMVTQCGVKSE
jgi:hypothetical protein